MNWKTTACDDDPSVWLGNAPGVDLQASGLPALVERLAPEDTDSRQVALAMFRYASALPFEISLPAERTQPGALCSLQAGDAYFKATLLVHLLRSCDVPARMRWVELEPRRLSRGLWDFVGHTGMPFFYPLTDAWLEGRWLTTDAYVMDPPLLRAVQRELARRRESSGFFVHRDGVADWDGRSDALQRFNEGDPESWPLRDMGGFHSHTDFLQKSLAAVPETQVTNMAYGHQARHANEAFARMRQSG